MTASVIVFIVINIVCTALNLTIFYLTTRARRAKRNIKIAGFMISPPSKMATEAPHMHRQESVRKQFHQGPV